MKTLSTLFLFLVFVGYVSNGSTLITLPGTVGGNTVAGDGSTDDATAINAILAANPSAAIEFTGTHTYLIGALLLAPSHTHIYLDSGATIKRKNTTHSGTNPEILANSNYASGSNFDITIEGSGTIDGNRANQTNNCCEGMLSFHNTSWVRVSGITLKDPSTFSAFCVDGCNHFQFTNLTLTQTSPAINMDGPHISGAASDGLIDNISGTAGDDIVCLCANEGAGGDETGITIRRISANSTWSGVRFRTDTQHLGKVLVQNLTGAYTSGWPIFFSTPAGGSANAGLMDNIQIDTSSATGNSGNFVEIQASHITATYSNISGGSTAVHTTSGSSNSVTSGTLTPIPGLTTGARAQ